MMKFWRISMTEEENFRGGSKPPDLPHHWVEMEVGVEEEEDLISDRAIRIYAMSTWTRRKNFARFVGVADSTAALWWKSLSFPEYIRQLVRLHRNKGKLEDELKEARRDEQRFKVVKDHDQYLIVKPSNENGKLFNEVIARGIDTYGMAASLASYREAWDIIFVLWKIVYDEIPRKKSRAERVRLAALTDRISALYDITFVHGDFSGEGTNTKPKPRAPRKPPPPRTMPRKPKPSA